MQISAELRWFWQDPAPPELDEWFRSGGVAPGGGLLREDCYQLERGQAELGIKRRDNRGGVEVKGLVDARSSRGGLFAGPVQIWGKWTTYAVTIDPAHSIVVSKTRWIRKYDTTGPDVRELVLDVHEQPAGGNESLPACGCNVELVELAVRRARWWTVGFEAFGPLETVEVSLRRTIDAAGLPPASALGRGSELSYPAWLDSITSGPSP